MLRTKIPLPIFLSETNHKQKNFLLSLSKLMYFGTACYSCAEEWGEKTGDRQFLLGKVCHLRLRQVIK